MPQGIDRIRRRLVFQFVIDQELVGGLADRLALLGAAFVFDDLAVRFLQPLALTALLLDRLFLVGASCGTATAAPVDDELEMVVLAVLEDAHLRRTLPGPH